MKIGVKVLPRKEVLDTQGRAVGDVLKRHGQDLNACRVGKYIVLDIPVESRDQALDRARTMAEQVLYNPLIEEFELEVL